jgi:hypothetical protein
MTNMRWVAVAMAFALAATACGKKDAAADKPPVPKAGGLTAEEVAKDPEAAAKKVGEALAAGDPTALATATTGGGDLSCDKLVPAALRTKYMGGAELQAGSMVNRTLMCSVNKDGGLAWHITYDCRRTTTLKQFQQKAVEKEKPAIVGLGRAAFGSDTQLEFYDDDADCHVTVSAYREGDKVTDLAKDVAAALKPPMLPPLEMGKYALDCDKLLPADLRDKFLKDGKASADSVMVDQMACKFELPDFKSASVNYTCGGTFDDKFIPQMKEQMIKQGARFKTEPPSDVAIGKGGLYVSMMGTHSVSFIDGETGCLVAVMNMAGDKAASIELAKAVEAALTAESAK